MKKISALPSPPVSRSKVNNEPNRQHKSNMNLKIPSDVSATFATDQETTPGQECVSYIYNSKPSALASQRHKQWKNIAIFLTVLITLVSLSLSLVFFTLSSVTDTSSTIAVGMDAFFAVMGAGFVLWRLCSPNEEHKTIVYREKTGSLFFGATFIISGVVTFGISTNRLFHSVQALRPTSVLIALAVAISITAILTLALYNVARKLNSPIMMALTIDTFFACVLLLGVFCTELVYIQSMPKLWYLDDVVAIVISVFFVLCGMNLITNICCDKSTKKEKYSEQWISKSRLHVRFLWRFWLRFSWGF